MKLVLALAFGLDFLFFEEYGKWSSSTYSVIIWNVVCNLVISLCKSTEYTKNHVSYSLLLEQCTFKEISLNVVCRLFHFWLEIYELIFSLYVSHVGPRSQRFASMQKRLTETLTRREEPDVPSAVRAERSAAACGSLSAIQMIGGRRTLRTVNIQSIMSLDRWSAVCARPYIQLCVSHLVWGQIIYQFLTSMRWALGTACCKSEIHGCKVRNVPALDKFRNMPMSWYVVPGPFQYFN